MDTVSYRVASIIQSYDNREGIKVMDKGDMIYVDITRQFPSPGHIMTVDRIQKQDGEYKVYFMVQPPASDRVLPQIITYKTLSIKIPKNELDKPPYKFKAFELRMA